MPLAEDQRTRGEAYPRTVPRMYGRAGFTLLRHRILLG
jgi:hypothetical protein